MNTIIQESQLSTLYTRKKLKTCHLVQPSPVFEETITTRFFRPQCPSNQRYNVPECSTYASYAVADKISEKRDISISKGRAWVRTKLSFCLLRSTHRCIRGKLTKRQYMHITVAETNIWDLADADTEYRVTVILIVMDEDGQFKGEDAETKDAMPRAKKISS